MTVDGANGRPTNPTARVLRSDAEKSADECRRQVKEVLGTAFPDATIDKAISNLQSRMAAGANLAERAGEVIQEILDTNVSGPTPASSPTRVVVTAPEEAEKAPESASGGEDEQMRKAIALSLESGNGAPKLSKEEAELQRALEASMMDAPSTASLFQDPANPHQRRRPSPQTPAGLKNVGNTCWLNVVVQHLFHLPRFRRLVLAADLATLSKDDEMPSPKAEFIRELQRTFALLLLSPRAYIDPSALVTLLRAQSPSLGGQSLHGQEDVNEVTHALLALVEGALKELPIESGTSNADSPIHALLPSLEESPSVSFEPSGLVEEMFFTAAEKTILPAVPGQPLPGNLETHLLLPVEVGGVERVEEGLESSLCSEIEGGGQSETWLIRAPPVLLLDLKRFGYSREKAAAEKLHSRLAFPPTLFLDRYLKRNRGEVVTRRAKVAALRRTLTELTHRLESFDNFESSGVPLSRALELVLRVFGRTPTADPAVTADPSVPSPPGQSSPMETDSGKASPRAERMETEERGLASDVAAVSAQLQPLNQEMAAATLSDLARRVNAATDELKRQISEVRCQIDGAYDEEHLKKEGYRLHAVLVHEGQVSSGHYWAYVRDADSDGWTKFNDVQVAHVEWSEVEQNGFGGGSNASAYCLVYVADASASHVFESKTLEEERLGLSPATLSAVDSDAASFQDEIRAWDAVRSAPPDPPIDPAQAARARALLAYSRPREWTQTGAEAAVTCEADEENWGLSEEDLALLRRNRETARDLCELLRGAETSEAFLRAVEDYETTTKATVAAYQGWLRSGGEWELDDPRLCHPLHLGLSLAPPPPPLVLRRLLLQQLQHSFMHLPEEDRRPEIRTALDSLLLSSPLSSSDQQIFVNVHKCWHILRECAVLLKKIAEDYLKDDAQKDAETVKFICLLLGKEREGMELLSAFSAYPMPLELLKLLTLLRLGRRDVLHFRDYSAEELHTLEQRYRNASTLLTLQQAPAAAALTTQVAVAMTNGFTKLAADLATTPAQEAKAPATLEAILTALWAAEGRLTGTVATPVTARDISAGLKAKIKPAPGVGAELAKAFADLQAAGLKPSLEAMGEQLRRLMPQS